MDGCLSFPQAVLTHGSFPFIHFYSGQNRNTPTRNDQLRPALPYQRKFTIGANVSDMTFYSKTNMTPRSPTPGHKPQTELLEISTKISFLLHISEALVFGTTGTNTHFPLYCLQSSRASSWSSTNQCFATLFYIR